MKFTCLLADAVSFMPAQLAENYDAPQLGKACALYALEHFEGVAAAPATAQAGGFDLLLRRMVSVLESSLTDTLVANAMAPAAPPAPGPTM